LLAQRKVPDERKTRVGGEIQEGGWMSWKVGLQVFEGEEKNSKSKTTT